MQILLVEDDAPSARLVSSALEREGYETLLASNGVEGLRKATQNTPDLVILDVMLPGLDGFEVCHKLRENPDTAKIPILMLSAKDQESDVLTGEKVGADRYLVKSTDPSNIVATVKSLLSRNEAQPVSPHSSGN